MERNTLRMDTIYESRIGVLEDDDFSAINVQDDLSKPLDGKEVLRVISQYCRK